VQLEGPWVEHAKEEKSEDEEHWSVILKRAPSTRVLNLSIRIRNSRAATQFRIQRQTLLPPYYLHSCSLPLTLFICFLFLSCSSLSLFILCTCSTHGSAQCTAPPTPTGLLFKLSNLHSPNKKKTLFFHAIYSSWTTLMMKAETSSEMSVTTILTNQQSSIFHKT